jgi:hypothetical protein
VRTDGQTDVTKLTVTFRTFVKAPKYFMIYFPQRSSFTFPFCTLSQPKTLHSIFTQQPDCTPKKTLGCYPHVRTEPLHSTIVLIPHFTSTFTHVLVFHLPQNTTRTCPPQTDTKVSRLSGRETHEE